MNDVSDDNNNFDSTTSDSEDDVGHYSVYVNRRKYNKISEYSDHKKNVFYFMFKDPYFKRFYIIDRINYAYNIGCDVCINNCVGDCRPSGILMSFATLSESKVDRLVEGDKTRHKGYNKIDFENIDLFISCPNCGSDRNITNIAPILSENADDYNNAFTCKCLIQ